MYWVADLLLIFFLGLLLYRGIKKGFLNSPFTLVTTLLDLVLGIGSAFAISFFVFPLFGWTEDMQIGLLDFAHNFAGILQLLKITAITVEDIAYYLAIGIPTIFLIAPFYFLWRWIDGQFQRFVRFVRSKCAALKVIGSILGGVINFAVGAVIVLGMFWVFAALDGSGVFTYTNEVLRSGTLTSLVYEHNPLYGFLGEQGCLAETVGNIIKGNFF